jgi:hypothetical protein
VRYGENVRFVNDLVRVIARELNPEHLMVVTEGDKVNPLTFHMVYHAALSGYLFGVRKILQLHQYGGGYFYDGYASDLYRSYKSLVDH